MGRLERGLVIDPCLGRCDVLIAKARLGLVLLAGVFCLMVLGKCVHWWLGRHLKAGVIPSSEVSLVIGVLVPVVFAAFLCALEHAESRFVSKVSPQTTLGYTPLVHRLWPSLQQPTRRTPWLLGAD